METVNMPILTGSIITYYSLSFYIYKKIGDYAAIKQITVDVGYKNTFGSRKICSYNRYKIYSRYENRFIEDGSYHWYQRCSHTRVTNLRARVTFSVPWQYFKKVLLSNIVLNV